VLARALVHARRGETPQALAAFRRALALDHEAVERDAHAMRMLAQAFLRRAEALQREGRDDIARVLLEEGLSADLRKVPTDLRLALEQRLLALRSKFELGATRESVAARNQPQARTSRVPYGDVPGASEAQLSVGETRSPRR
jgi:hypothetical protein